MESVVPVWLNLSLLQKEAYTLAGVLPAPKTRGLSLAAWAETDHGLRRCAFCPLGVAVIQAGRSQKACGLAPHKVSFGANVCVSVGQRSTSGV